MSFWECIADTFIEMVKVIAEFLGWKPSEDALSRKVLRNRKLIRRNCKIYYTKDSSDLDARIRRGVFFQKGRGTEYATGYRSGFVSGYKIPIPEYGDLIVYTPKLERRIAKEMVAIIKDIDDSPFRWNCDFEAEVFDIGTVDDFAGVLAVGNRVHFSQGGE